MGKSEGVNISSPPNLRGNCIKPTKKYQILELIVDKPHSRKELLEKTGFREKTVDGILSKLAREGSIKLLRKGVYAYKNYDPEKEKKLTIKDSGGITNYGFDIKHLEYANLEVILVISNPTKNKIGIRHIGLISDYKNYPILGAYMQQITKNGYEDVSSFILKPEETKEIKLLLNHIPKAPMKKKFIPVYIEIHDTKDEIIQRIKMKLFIGFRAFQLI